MTWLGSILKAVKELTPTQVVSALALLMLVAILRSHELDRREVATQHNDIMKEIAIDRQERASQHTEEMQLKQANLDAVRSLEAVQERTFGLILEHLINVKKDTDALKKKQRELEGRIAPEGVTAPRESKGSGDGNEP